MGKYHVGDMVFFEALSWIHPKTKLMAAPILSIEPQDDWLTLYIVAINRWIEGVFITEVFLLEKEILGIQQKSDFFQK